MFFEFGSLLQVVCVFFESSSCAIQHLTPLLCIQPFALCVFCPQNKHPLDLQWTDCELHIVSVLQEPLDRWHTYLAANRSVKTGSGHDASLEGLLYLAHPWESLDPMAQLWVELLPAPTDTTCLGNLPSAVRDSPFWGSSYAYCQATDLLEQMQVCVCVLCLFGRALVFVHF